MQRKTRSWLVYGSVSVLAVAAWLVFSADDSDGPMLSNSSTAEVQAKQDLRLAGSHPSAPSLDPVDPLPPPGQDSSPTRATFGAHRGSMFGQPTVEPNAARRERSPISRPGNKTDVGHRPDGEAGGGAQHQLIDRTGRGENLAAQLDDELMPLAAECIELAKERNPKLSGLLSFAVNLVPIDDNKILVESVEPQQDNEVNDAELFECIEQSTLSIAGLETPESFAITMPITPDTAQ